MTTTRSSANTKPKTYSTLAFILAAIGAVVGLGNIWRFPKVMISGGGSAFIIVYLIMLIVLVVPIIFLEMQYGLFFKKDPITCFRKAGEKSGSFWGWIAVFSTAAVVSYYVIIVGWVAIAAFNSVANYDATADGSLNFANDILLSPADPYELSTTPLSDIKFSSVVFFGAAAMIILGAALLWFGAVKALSAINLFLVPPLFIMIIFMALYSLTLDGAATGIKVLFKFDAAAIFKFGTWYDATLQAFFSTGVVTGIYIIFSRKSNIKIDKGNDVVMIVAGDTLICVLSGIMIASIVAANLKSSGGNEMNNAKLENELKTFFNTDSSSGATFAFGALPEYFKEISPVHGQKISIMFFFSLLFAGFSSFVGLLEVVIDSTSHNFKRLTRKKSIVFFSCIFLILGLVYSTSFGEDFTNQADKIVLYVVLFVAFAEVYYFVYYKHAKLIVKKNQKYSYLKLGKGDFLIWFNRLVVMPLLTFIIAVGILKITGAGAIINELNADLGEFLAKAINGLNADGTIKAFEYPKLTYGLFFAMLSYGGLLSIAIFGWTRTRGNKNSSDETRIDKGDDLTENDLLIKELDNNKKTDLKV